MRGTNTQKRKLSSDTNPTEKSEPIMQVEILPRYLFKKYFKMDTVRHIVGVFKDNKQECIMCGELICDYTHAMFPEGQAAPSGWPIGELYITGKFPKIYETTPPANTTINDCVKTV